MVAILMLLLVAPGGMRDVADLSSVDESPAVLSTAAPAAAPVAPAANELEAARALEAQLITVYETASLAVVNITSRNHVYDWLRQAIPQEGTGSGFLHDSEGHIIINYYVVEDEEELLVALLTDGCTKRRS